MSPVAAFWALVPAAGVGVRMGSERPKQYLDLCGRPLIEHSLAPLLEHPGLRGLVVSLASSDGWWASTGLGRHPLVAVTNGGAERCQSVLNGLDWLHQRAGPDAWVLVHDAARPCLRRADLDRLLETLAAHPVGGLLGVPVRDTIKQVDPDRTVLTTLVRDGLWQAYTPQMFRLGLLRQALGAALARGILVTDEAQAMELAGFRPQFVEGRADNLKVTRPEDLPLAAFYLHQIQAERTGRPAPLASEMNL